jgi:ferric-dicitrate binding protein FerR (iron transport regulator)
MQKKRDISLKGKASFKVAKDKTKPFTVYSGDIATTALGTEFVVTNYERDQIITVRLLEGRVVIKSIDSAEEKLKTAFYLMPGQELLYNKRSVYAEVRKFSNDVSQFKYKGNKSADNPSLPESNDGSWFMFNNQSLPDILDQLKAMYAIDIVYNRSELEKLYFIGKFNKSDSVEYILRNIARANRLKLSKENNRFIIRK